MDEIATTYMESFNKQDAAGAAALFATNAIAVAPSATFVKESGKWKIRMLSTIPKPPPA